MRVVAEKCPNECDIDYRDAFIQSRHPSKSANDTRWRVPESAM